MNAYAAYSIVGGVCAFASLLVAVLVTKTFHNISDGGMWAIAAMSSAPAFLGVGVSLFIALSHRAEPRRERERRFAPDDGFDPGAFLSKDR